MLGEVLDDGERRNGEDLLLAHEAHGLVGELEGVIDGDDAGARGVERARFAGGVNCHVLAHARGFLDRGGQLGFGVLVGRGEFAVADGVAAGFVDLDEIGALLELLADDGDQFGRRCWPRWRWTARAARDCSRWRLRGRREYRWHCR